jgi:hypothetical protein
VNHVILQKNCVTDLNEGRASLHHHFITTLNSKIMGNLLYLVAVILVIGWAVGFIGFHAGGLIHILLVIALIAVILRIISGRNPV